MSTFTVTTECGTSGDFETIRDADAGKRTHELLCEECDEDEIRIEAAPEQSTLDARASEVADDGASEVADAGASEVPDGGPGGASDTTTSETSDAETNEAPHTTPKETPDAGTGRPLDVAASTGDAPDDPTPDPTPARNGRGHASVPAAMGDSVRTDPLDVVPEYMIDEVEGQPTINKRGYAVIASHFDIVVNAEPITTAGETDHEYAEFRATAWQRGDDPEQAYTGHATARASEDRRGIADNLNEMAETRAMKRAVAWASGVGILAWEEMAGYVDEGEA